MVSIIHFVTITILILSNIVPFSYCDTSGDAMSTRELMAMDAANEIIKAFQTIDAQGLSASICDGISDYKFPDMCMPDEEQGGKYLHTDEEGNTKEATYEDTRPTDGKNTPQKLESNEKFKGTRTGDYTGYKIQPDTPQNDKVRAEVCAASMAGKAFDRSAKGDTIYGDLAATTSWQYFGGQETGLFAQYPASIKTMCWCDEYDPRYRPWYAAAVTGPKDMIFVLDASGSMRDKVEVKEINENGEEEVVEKERLEIMKEAAIAQLNTATFSDFIQVVVYSTGALSNSGTCKFYTYIWYLHTHTNTHMCQLTYNFLT